MTGESKGIMLENDSNDLYGINLKIKLVEKFFVSSMLKAPFVPEEGLMVPDK